MFSDENLFCIGGCFNRKKNVVNPKSRSEANLNRGTQGQPKFPLSVMVWCGLTVYGPKQPYIVNKGETINAEYDINKILPHVLY